MGAKMMFSSLDQNKDWMALMDAVDAAPVVAPCTNTDPDLWFADSNHADDMSVTGTTGSAKKLCQACPVVSECLQYALKHEPFFGVWGGMTASERSRLKRRH